MLFSSGQVIFAQENSLEYFLKAAEKNNPALLQNKNLLEIGQYDNQFINAQNNSVNIDVTSEVMVAPYFNNYGNFIDITTKPSPDAYGYAEPITNGALYSAQLNITKDIFNRASVQNLLFQNKLKNGALFLSAEEIKHQLHKNITNAYIQVYHLQLKEEITKDLISDLENRLKVVEILVKKAVLMQSDYLLLQLEIENKKLELQQLQNNLNSSLLSLYNAVGIKITEIKQLAAPEITLTPEAKTYLGKIPIPGEVAGYQKDSLDYIKTEFPDFIAPTDTSYFYQRKFKNDSLQLVAEQNVFENKYRPQFRAYGNTGINAVEAPRIPHNVGFSAGLKLIVPIYDGGQKKIKRLQNELKLENLEYQKKNDQIKKQNTLQSLEKQMASMKTGLQLINNQLKKQEHILEVYKGKMVQGQVSIIDYLKVVQNYKLDLETKLQMKINLWLLENEYNATNW
ncbi:hypothetical protein C7S20_07190 [Christiangramia fulva]|uniref:Transporter n=2 Tax=Christiangramia fulva TaxID=2126553 RepID=A0A2R3Z472_9FLAO|nr:hypothetical protein C7S20_07190 [Christiangramia fulva]